jgi:hypothetical protein
VEICTVGSVRGESVGAAMVDLNGHEAGNGGHSQGTPTAHRPLFYSERCPVTNRELVRAKDSSDKKISVVGQQQTCQNNQSGCERVRMPAYSSPGSGTGWKPRSASWADISIARSGDLASTIRACGPQPIIVMFRALQNTRVESSHDGFFDGEKRDIERSIRSPRLRDPGLHDSCI